MTIKKLKNFNLKGFELLIASCCTGNVGQLTADLWINSLEMEKFALFYHPAIIPMIGPSAYNDSQKELSTASEFFVCEKNKIVLLLIRSPITAYYLQELCEEIINFVKTEEINEIIQLSAAFSYEQHFVQQTPFEFISNDSFTISDRLLSNFNKTSNSKIPGSGIATKLHEMATNSQIASIILYKYVSEGDNLFDAIQFATKFNNLFDLKPIHECDGKVDFKIPCSWKHLFGHDANMEIY